MQFRSTEVYGLEPVDDVTSPKSVLALMFGVAAVPLILGTAYFLGSQATLLNDQHGGLSAVNHVAARAALSALAAVPTDTGAPQVFAQVSPEQAVAINASIPFSSAPNPAARPFVLAAIDPVDHLRAQTCLTMAVYYEAANQGVVGEAAVAQVVLNRLRNPLFPKTVCGVVFQGSTLPTGCQFTFTCDGSLNRPPDPLGWKQASAVAERALNGYVAPEVGEATHYHTVWVVPYWLSTVDKVAQIGAHIFYRWRGPLGDVRAFGYAYTGSEPLPTNVEGFDFGPRAVVPADAVVYTARVAEREPPHAPEAIITTSRAAAPSAARPTAVALLTPALPRNLETQPAALPVVNPQADPVSNHHLAIPVSW